VFIHVTTVDLGINFLEDLKIFGYFKLVAANGAKRQEQRNGRSDYGEGKNTFLHVRYIKFLFFCFFSPLNTHTVTKDISKVFLCA